MARKKKKRRGVRGAPLFSWIVLGCSLSVIGYACSHKETAPPAQRRVASHRVALVTPPAASEAMPAPAPSASASAAPPVTAATPAIAPSAVASEPPAPAVTPVRGPVPAGTGARLAVIIDDCGQWPEVERGFIALPVPLTLSVLPDVRYNHAISAAAAGAGKGVMLHLPMETLSGMNPGPGKVTTEMDDAAIAATLTADLADVPLARGVNNHEGSKATADARVMNAVAAVLAAKGDFFVDSRTSAKSVAQDVAAQHGVPTAARSVFLDNTADVDYTKTQLRAAADIAKRTGSAIAIGHPRPTTLAAVRELVPELQAQGIDFVLASELVR